MTTSKRLSERKIAKFEKNITRRGLGAFSTKKSFLEPAHIVLVLFAVLVIASFLIQIIRMALKSGVAD